MDPSADDGRLPSPIVCDRCAGRETFPPLPWFSLHRHGIQFPLITLFSVTSLVCVFFATVRLLGGTGAILFADIAILAIGIANLRRIRSAFGVRIPRLSLVEFLVLTTMCLWFHGLSLPAAVSSCHGLRATVPPAPVTAPTVPTTSSPNTITNAPPVDDADQK